MAQSYLIVILAFVGAETSPEHRTNVMQEFQGTDALLQKELMKDEMWMEKNNKALLLKYLQTASAMRSQSVASILAKNIGYLGSNENDIPIEERYPAYKALRDLSMGGVKSIVKELMSFDPEDPEVKTLADEQEKLSRIIKLKHRASKEHAQSMLIYCLVQVYDEGGFGVALARQRLELEAGKAKGVQKERLLKALKHHFLK